MAATKGQAAVAKLLLDHGADVEAADDMGNTALHCVAEGWRPELKHTLEAKLAETAVLLVVAGADAAAPNSSSRSPEALARDRGWSLAFQAALAEGRRRAGPKPEGTGPTWVAWRLSAEVAWMSCQPTSFKPCSLPLPCRLLCFPCTLSSPASALPPFATVHPFNHML